MRTSLSTSPFSETHSDHQVLKVRGDLHITGGQALNNMILRGWCENVNFCPISTYTSRYHLFANHVNQPMVLVGHQQRIPRRIPCHSPPIVTEECCFFGLIQLIRAPRSLPLGISYDFTVELCPRISYLIPNVETY